MACAPNSIFMLLSTTALPCLNLSLNNLFLLRMKSKSSSKEKNTEFHVTNFKASQLTSHITFTLFALSGSPATVTDNEKSSGTEGQENQFTNCVLCDPFTLNLHA